MLLTAHPSCGVARTGASARWCGATRCPRRGRGRNGGAWGRSARFPLPTWARRRRAVQKAPTQPLRAQRGARCAHYLMPTLRASSRGQFKRENGRVGALAKRIWGRNGDIGPGPGRHAGSSGRASPGSHAPLASTSPGRCREEAVRRAGTGASGRAGGASGCPARRTAGCPGKQGHRAHATRSRPRERPGSKWRGVRDTP